MAWRLAIWPTRRSPFSVNPTTDGVVRFPSALAMTTGSPPDMMATQEFVVPRSIPITLPMAFSFPSPLNHERATNRLRRRLYRRVPAFVRTARGDRHHRWPQHAVVQVVTLFIFLHDRIRYLSLGIHRRHCLVHGRIKGLPHAGDRPDTETRLELLFEGLTLLFAGARSGLRHLGSRGIGVRRGLLDTGLRLVERAGPACFFYRIALFSHSMYSALL